ncbi:TPA: Bro-N domain-containing protein [Pseudomonas aeruginosa]|nr:Bro-N domain-containing protein [Pseudomonas aeruginosa]
MTLPIQYAFEGTHVRIAMINGEPWFVAADVLASLALDRKALERIDDDEKGVNSIHTPGGIQQMTTVNEPGLYSLILGSRKPEAKRFKRWVTHEVLPAIRQHGAYSPSPIEQDQRGTAASVASNIDPDALVSAGKVFNTLFRTARHMGMTRQMAAGRASEAAQRSTGVDLITELAPSTWLNSSELSKLPLRVSRDNTGLQQRIHSHLEAHGWPQAFTGQQLIEELGLVDDRANRSAVGKCLSALNYRRTRLSTQGRPWVYTRPTALKGGDLA